MTRFETERRLARFFFTRFFESDLMPAGVPQVHVVIWAIALLTAPGYLLSFVFVIKYDRLAKLAPARIPDAILADELLFVTFGMLALGFVALLTWDRVFPDRRDVRILGMLPLPDRAHVIARVAALAVLAALFAVGVNLPAALVYGTFRTAAEGYPSPLRGGGAHLLATGLGGLFTFFLVVAAQGALLTVAGYKAAHRLATILQGACIVAMLQALLWVPAVAAVARHAFEARAHPVVPLLPPVWFLALYEHAVGSPRLVPAGYVLAAVLAPLVVFGAGALLVAVSYRRLVRAALETAPDSPGGSAVVRRAAALAGRLLTSDPVSRAVGGFTLRTLLRSRTHTMLLASAAGAAAAIALASIVPLLVTQGWSALDTPGAVLLSAPLVFNAVVLSATRVLFAIPTEMKANWMFRLCAPVGRMPEAVAGARAVLMGAGVGPAIVIAVATTAPLWGPGIAALHAVYVAVLGVLLTDVLLIGFRKVPFTCTYMPGRARAKTMLPLYLLAFSIYAYWMARVEVEYLQRPLSFLPGFAVAAVVVLGLGWLRRRDLRPPPGWVFEEEEHDALLPGLQLSEGVAAERHPVP